MIVQQQIPDAQGLRMMYALNSVIIRIMTVKEVQDIRHGIRLYVLHIS